MPLISDSSISYGAVPEVKKGLAHFSGFITSSEVKEKLSLRVTYLASLSRSLEVVRITIEEDKIREIDD